MTSEPVLLHLDPVHISSHLDNHSLRTRQTKPKTPSERIVIYLQIAGFYNVSFLRGYKLVPGLITALVERWRPETHTFHFPLGECTITLQDVVMQLGVPINGNAVVGHDSYNVFELCGQLLGKVPPATDVRGSRVKLSWLDQEFKVTINSTGEEVQYAARAYMLHLIGGILMPDKSGNFVQTQYLPLLANFRETSQYSWGSATLAFLYNELCKAVILRNGSKMSDIGGCLTLLQSWAWYRLPYLTPIIKAPIEFPLAGRWRHDLKKAGVVHNNVVDVRLMIESKGKEQFIWMPYEGQEVRNCVPEYVWECAAFWGAMVPLIHFSIVEYQCADRVLRQFNIFQPIPKPPVDVEHIHTRASTAENETYVINLWDNRFHWLPEDSTLIEDDDYNCSSEYIEWFYNNGKPCLVVEEVSQRWDTEQRCSYQFEGRTVGPEPMSQQSAHETPITEPTNWPQWDSRGEPTRLVSGSSSINNLCEQATVSTTAGGSSSYYPQHDDDIYIPSMPSMLQHPQVSMYDHGVDVDGMSSWLSTTTISMPSFAEDIYCTPFSAQMMAGELNQGEQTPDEPNPRRMGQAPRRYDQTSSLHRQELPRRRRR